MHCRLSHIVLAISIIGAVCAAAEEAKKVDKNAKIREKAAELAKCEGGRVARLLAFQKFVRDEIKQVKTEYG